MMTTDHEMRMEALRLFEENERLIAVLRAVDHTLVAHGHVDSGTPLHGRITGALLRYEADIPDPVEGARVMIIMECCAWCGGPHPTVVNCEKAKRIREVTKPSSPLPLKDQRPKCKLCGLEDGACICAYIPALRTTPGKQS